MLLPTHMAATAALSWSLGLEGIDVLWAFVFGVMVDLDHVFYLKKWNDKEFWKSKGDKHCNHTFFHEPLGLVLVLIISAVSGYWIPLIFYSSHFFIDQFIAKALKKPLAPFSNRTYYYGIFEAGKRVEWIAAPFFVLLTIYYLATRVL